MSHKIEFETPENIGIAFEPAGLGTRFIAWLVDCMILWFLAFVIFIVVLFVGAFSENALRTMFVPMAEVKPGQPPQFTMYFVGVFILINGLMSFAYFGISELCFRGQTIGKRRAGLRVVRSDGFSLDANSILVRNVFRVIDNLPVLWIVPFVSRGSQRAGDMVAGTMVVTDRPEKMGGLRDGLADRPTAELRFRFPAASLKLLRPQDVETVERILERWSSIKSRDRDALLDRIIAPLAVRLQVEEPAPDDRRQFLEDLMASELRRQHRNLG